MVKPTGAVCNLDCTYCYYISKENLYNGSSFRMSGDVLENYIRQMLRAHDGPVVDIAFQGGEPTLMGLEFFYLAAELVEKYKKSGQEISFSMQTNGTLIDEKWCEFFRHHNVLVGLSIDGPKEIHDVYRINKGGRGTFERVKAAWDLMAASDVDVNVLCTVHSANQSKGVEVYRYFRDQLGAKFIQFIPIVERVTDVNKALADKGWHEKPGGPRPLYQQEGGLVTDRSVSPDLYGQFLCDIFDEWVSNDVGQVFVQMFDVTLSSYFQIHSLCVFAPTCGKAMALEHNGDVYSCDHFVEPKYLLGNVMKQRLTELVDLPQQKQFGQSKLSSLPKYCRDCDVRFACNGGCPKDRFAQTPDGENGLNYLCPSFRKFFRHSRPKMEQMASFIERGLPAAKILGASF